MERFLRRPLLVLATIGLAFAVTTAAYGAAVPARTALLTINYAGTFDMTNTAVPQSTTSSYDFHVKWSYWWSGTWGKLFRDRSRFNSDQTKFTNTTISGTTRISVRERVDSDVIECAVRIVKDPADPPRFMASYDSSAGTVQLTVEAPTFRGIKQEFISPKNPSCVGGPGVNIFGAPQTFNPLGAGGTVSLAKGGARRYDRSWNWKHAFGGGAERRYDARIKSQVQVTYKPCKSVKGCKR